MNKLLYFRSADTIAADDASADSVLVNVNSIRGLEIKSDSGDYFINIWHDSLSNSNQTPHWPGTLRGTSYVKIQIKGSMNVQKRGSIYKAFAELTNAGPHDDGVIVVADDVTKTYWHPSIKLVTYIYEKAQRGDDYDTQTIT